MIFLAGFLLFAFIFPGAAGFIMKLVSLFFLIPLAFFGVGYMFFFPAYLMGIVDGSMSSFVMCSLIFGTIPGIIVAKMTF